MIKNFIIKKILFSSIFLIFYNFYTKFSIFFEFLRKKIAIFIKKVNFLFQKQCFEFSYYF